MILKQKQKNKLWLLTWPFAHNNYTFLFNTIYFPKGRPPSDAVIRHESIHAQQIANYGWFKFYFLYLFAFPLFRNRYRYHWEYQAYKYGTRLSEKTLHSDHFKRFMYKKYGWIRHDYKKNKKIS